MHRSLTDRYGRLVSPIHRLSTHLKLGATIVLLVTTVITPGSFHLVFVGVGSVLVATALLSKIPFLQLVKQMLLLEIFVLGIVVLSLLQPGGILVFTTLLLKSTMCLLTVVLFSGTTPFSDLLRSLRQWGMPDLMVTVLALMYRYSFVMVDEMERMRRARASRTFVRRKRDLWRFLSAVVAQLFIRSTERAERIYAAMCARGWK